jgi:hypothetical protein
LIDGSKLDNGRCRMPHFFVINPNAISMQILNWEAKMLNVIVFQ